MHNNIHDDFRFKSGVAIRKDFRTAKHVSVFISILIALSVLSLLLK